MRRGSSPVLEKRFNPESIAGPFSRAPRFDPTNIGLLERALCTTVDVRLVDPSRCPTLPTDPRFSISTRSNAEGRSHWAQRRAQTHERKSQMVEHRVLTSALAPSASREEPRPCSTSYFTALNPIVPLLVRLLQARIRVRLES